MEIFYGSIGGLLAFIILSLLKVGTFRYVDEKAKNLATVQDIQEITNKIESVKTEYVNRSYAWQKFLDFEFEIVKDVWKASWELQASVRSLNPIIERVPENQEERRKVYLARYKYYGEKINLFREAVLSNQPFIPPEIYASSMEIKKLVIPIQVQFEMTFDNGRDPDWEKIIKNSEELDKKIDEFNVQIRTYLYDKL
jgi:hypothetical protein